MSNLFSFSETEKKAFREMVPLSSFAERKFQELCHKCRVEDADRGTLLFRQGEPNEFFYFLLSGTVGFSIGNITIETIQSGSAAARFALAHQLPRKVTATALTPIRFVRMEKDLLATEQPASKIGAPLQSITDLLLKRDQPTPETNFRNRAEKPEVSAFKRLFAWLRAETRESNGMGIPDKAGSSSNGRFIHENIAISDEGNFHDPTYSAARMTDPGPVAGIDQQSPILKQRWKRKRNLTREIAEQLQLTLLPLMRDISDISGSLVATEHGSLLSPEFPTHRINRIQAIARAATNMDYQESMDIPDEILVREKNSLILIFLMGSKGLLALHSNITANLGLIRLEASPVASRVKEIIWNAS